MNLALEQLSKQPDGDKTLARDCALLWAYLGKRTGQTRPPEPECPAFRHLADVFDLHPYEQRVLLLAAAIELDAGLQVLDADAAPVGSVAFALSRDPEATWSAWHPTSPLWRWHLLESDGDPGRPDTRFRIDVPLLQRLLGLLPADERLGMFRKTEGAAIALTRRQRRLAKTIHRQLLAAPDGMACIAIEGADHRTAKQVALTALEMTRLSAGLVDVDALPASPEALARSIRLLEREMLLDRRVPVFGVTAASKGRIARIVDAFTGPAVIVGDLSACDADRDIVRFELPAPSTEERQALWRAELRLETIADAEASLLARLAYHFPLGNSALRHIALAAEGTDATERLKRCWQSVRLRKRPSRHLMERVETAAGWDDLVLPDTQMSLLRIIAAEVRNRATVYEAWGFGKKSSRGLSVTALFCGASGVGKTFSAEVLAHDLELDLYRVDLARVVDKFVGETEKHLDAVFTQAAEAGAILLFDEADALFGQRGEVRQGQDRYANMTVGYLLQRMETYPGLAILCTNLKSQLDDAFMRRIRFAVHFPFPGQRERRRLWEKSFPKNAPTEGLDFKVLAKLSYNGGDIRTIALNAAFLAADEPSPITMTHIARAADIEAAKTGRGGEGAELRRMRHAGAGLPGGSDG